MVSEYFPPDPEPEWEHKHLGPEMLHSWSLHRRQGPGSRGLKWRSFFSAANAETGNLSIARPSKQQNLC